MQITSINKIRRLPLLIITVLVTFISCKKDSDGSPNDNQAGSMTSGTITPSQAPGGTVITLKGSGIGDIRSIVFEINNVPAPIISTLNTETALVFRVPDTASRGLQNIIFTNGQGKKLKVPFTVLAFPKVTDVSNYDFTIGSQITLIGTNLDDVISIVLDGTTTPVTIVSKTATQLVISMPSTTVSRAKLKITNPAGTITTNQEFVSIDNAYQIFTDAYGPNFQDGSWGDGGVISTTEHKTGTKSVGKKYAKGNWHLINFANWWPGLAKDPAYTYLTFWAKGASKDYSLYITTDKGVGGFGNFIDANKIDLPANVWTYFKIPLSKLDLWATGSPLNQLGFRIKGPDAQDETFYFDDILLVK